MEAVESPFRRLEQAPARAFCPMKLLLRRGAWWPFQLLMARGALLTPLIAVTPQGRAGFQTALFAMQALEMPAQPQARFTEEPPRNEAQLPHVPWILPGARWMQSQAGAAYATPRCWPLTM